MGGKAILLHVCNIIQQGMALENGQVMLYNQKKNIPPTTNLWVTVEYLGGKPFSSVRKFDELGISQQSVTIGAVFTIDIQSRDDSALERKEDVIMALGSQYAQSMQEKYGFKIGRLPSDLQNISGAEGAALPFHFTMSIQVQYKIDKQVPVDYYDQFTDSLITEG